MLRKVFGRDRANDTEEPSAPATSVPAQSTPPETTPEGTAAERAAADLVAASFDNPQVPGARRASEGEAVAPAEAVAAEEPVAPAEAVAEAVAPAEAVAEAVAPAKAVAEAQAEPVAEAEPVAAAEAEVTVAAEDADAAPVAEAAEPAVATEPTGGDAEESAAGAAEPTATAEEPAAAGTADSDEVEAPAADAAEPTATAEEAAVAVEEPAADGTADSAADAPPAELTAQAEAADADATPSDLAEPADAPQAQEAAPVQIPAARAAEDMAEPAGTDTDAPVAVEADAPAPVQATSGPALPLSKVKAVAPQLAEAYKAAGAVLKKQGLTGARAAVYLVVDRSGSMRPYFKDGSVQRLAEQTVALAAHLSEDAAVTAVFFSTDIDGTAELRPADLTPDRVETLNATLGRMGRTNYHRAVEEVLAHHEKNDPARPALVVFQTDGAPESRTAATQALAEAADRPVHWRFTAWGEEDGKAFDYLRKLPGTVPNTGVHLAGPAPLETPHAAFYRGLLAELPAL
ncbi:VWA domain-containing protein [Streptomyces sp. NPDC094032]|uniref:VWA domain-containing protein n=1 Tax=Streptomyces sp. NPDC094032 TaxID=3155308 RepID=UPI003327B6EE